jgi:pimeloyl-ACP methyl ester carboxylesterase
VRVIGSLLAVLILAPGVATAVSLPRSFPHTDALRFHYRAHDGVWRQAWLLLPSDYHGQPLPLVISPHGRGVPALYNAAHWGPLPALGGFAVVNPGGQGRRLGLYSWGDPGQIADLARMPAIVHRALPWLRIGRVYAVGGSMGGQETLLLAARYPHLLSGAVAFDAPTNMARRYRDFAALRHGHLLQRLALEEIGAPPGADPAAWRARSPLDDAERIAASRVPLQLWWSPADDIVRDAQREDGALYRRLYDLGANVTGVVGCWGHTAELRPWSGLPWALSMLGLLPRSTARSVGWTWAHRFQIVRGPEIPPVDCGARV